MLVTAKYLCYGENYGKQCLFQQSCVLRVGVLHTGARPESSPGLSAQHARYGENYGKQCLSQRNMLVRVRITANNACYGENYGKQCLLW